MSARLTQTGFTAGATLRLSAVLTEYGVPLSGAPAPLPRSCRRTGSC